MTQAPALIPIDLRRGRLGLPSRLGHSIAGETVLAHTLRRVASVQSVDRLILVHPASQDLSPVLSGIDLGKPVVAFADPQGLCDRTTGRTRVARLWAPTTWRGGLGGATVFDELLPAGALASALKAHGASSALIVGGDWCVVDPVLCEAVLAQHLAAPDGMKLCFTQAPPGLCGVATTVRVLDDLDENGAGFGHILGYNPRAPIPDPIGKEANVAIPPEVRDAAVRFVADTPRSVAMLSGVAATLADRFGDADATTLVRAADPQPFATLPTFVSLELTPRRNVAGPLTPQHYASFERVDLDVGLAARLADQLAEPGDVCVLLGGPVGGDPLLHPAWERVAQALRDAGVASVGVETDLLCGEDGVRRLLDSPIDLVSVRLNADTGATYARVMGADRFAAVIRNLEAFLNTRNRRTAEGGREGRAAGVPWLLPRMIKSHDTLGDLESFFDKWTHYAGHAVIEPWRSGCGVAPNLDPVPMAPPLRRPCRQIDRRLTILSDGSVAQCDQDWHGRAPLGDAGVEALAEIWRRGEAICETHREGRFTDLTLCGACAEWHRP